MSPLRRAQTPAGESCLDSNPIHHLFSRDARVAAPQWRLKGVRTSYEELDALTTYVFGPKELMPASAKFRKGTSSSVREYFGDLSQSHWRWLSLFCEQPHLRHWSKHPSVWRQRKSPQWTWRWRCRSHARFDGRPRSCFPGRLSQRLWKWFDLRPLQPGQARPACPSVASAPTPLTPLWSTQLSLARATHQLVGQHARWCLARAIGWTFWRSSWLDQRVSRLRT